MYYLSIMLKLHNGKACVFNKFTLCSHSFIYEEKISKISWEMKNIELVV